MDQEKTLQNILETVEFIKDTAATKQELNDLEQSMDSKIGSLEQSMDSKIDNLEERMDSKLTEAKDEIITQIDKFIALHQKLDLEMSAFRSRFERLELEMQKSFKNRNSEA